MQFNVLTKEVAFSEGAALWILPTFVYSDWTRRLDWPLNLQITRAVYHVRPDLPPELKKIIDSNDVNYEWQPPAGKPPLLIASQHLLPNLITAVVDAEQAESWLSTSLELWKGLLRPSLRLFLPSFLDINKMKSLWPKWAETEHLQIMGPETANPEGEGP